MVAPQRAHVVVPLADLRASTDAAAELVDQVHYAEQLTVLASRDGWHFVQAVEDHYFGWIEGRAVIVFSGPRRGGRQVGVTLAPIYRAADMASEVLGYLPVGTLLAPAGEQDEGAFVKVALGRPRPTPHQDPSEGYVALANAVEVADVPHRPPTAHDLIATAEAFLGVPYLWGGTTAIGLDCSGFVEQVYRLNGIRLDRDADQQATEGREVGVPQPGDLIFFGAKSVTHVALATGERTFLHAPQTGAFVERSELSPARNVLAIRRYLPDPA
jgi:cell wall-associated NlpC family hydrolase